MADVVWNTLCTYGIENRVSITPTNTCDDTNEIYIQIFAFMLDNASNNDTMVDEIERRARAQGIIFNAKWGRLHCMPHTIHLAAIKVRSFTSMVIESNVYLIFHSFYRQLEPCPLQKPKRLPHVVVTIKIPQQNLLTPKTTTMWGLGLMILMSKIRFASVKIQADLFLLALTRSAFSSF